MSVSACVVSYTGYVSVSVSRDGRIGVFVQVVVYESCVSLWITLELIIFDINSVLL